MPTIKKVTRKVAPEAQKAAEETAENNETQLSNEAPRPKKRSCYFCESKTEPSYTDSVALRKFVSDRSKIVSRARTGACSKHQRKITREIKHARHLALLPFLTRV